MSKAQVDTVKWIDALQSYLKLARITHEDILDREIFRIKVQKLQPEQEEGLCIN